jgi:DHA2 family multidrug resistance protein-like MFS transporter
MTNATLNATSALDYKGSNRLILGIVLAVITFWLFAQTTLNIAPTMRDDLHITNSASASFRVSPPPASCRRRWH